MRHLSHTSVQDFLTCPRKFEWRRIRRIKKQAKAKSLRMGTAYHLGLDLLKRKVPIEDTVCLMWERFEDIPSWVSNLDAWFVEREICVRLLIAWEFFTDPLDVVLSEAEFEVKIRNPDTGWSTGRFRLRGVLDSIARLEDGRTGIVEHKTTSQSLEPHSDYIRRLRVDSQISRYLNAARDMELGVSAMIYDITRKPSIRPKKVTKKAAKLLRSEGTYFDQPIEIIPKDLERETPEMYGARLNDDICRRPEHYFLRLEIPRLEKDLKAEARELWQQQQVIARAMKTGHFYRNTNACLSPYRCEYADLCLSGITPGTLEPGEVPEGYTSTKETP